MLINSKKLVLRCIIFALVYLNCCVAIFAQRDSSASPSAVPPNNFNFDSLIAIKRDTIFYIRNIFIEGNRKTRTRIILRELPFTKGDSIHLNDLPQLFAKVKTQLSNTSLFTLNDLNVTIAQSDGVNVDIKIKVKERWYLFPLPHLRPVDRNLNQWLFEKGASTSRLDYGIKLDYENVSGNRDKLKFYFITGYTRQFRLSYSRPFIDKNMKWGLNTDLSLGETHEVNYATVQNKQQFFKDDNFARNFLKGNAEFVYRPALYTRHGFSLGYNNYRVADTVAKLNPNYFSNAARQVKYLELYYKLSYLNVDYIPYPTEGYAGELILGKQGFNSRMNMWYLNMKGVGYWHLGGKSFYSVSALGSLKLPFKQPYYNAQLLGYGDYLMRGYEYYVVDGVAGGLLNTTIGTRLANFSLNLPVLKKYTSRLIPLKIYGKVYGNTGYVYNGQQGYNSLSNRMLYGGGIGFDVITDYDFTLKIDFSVNHLGETGVYFQKKTLY